MGGSDILRVFRVVPKPGYEEPLAARLAADSVRLVAAQPGWRGALAAGPEMPGGELVFLSLWSDIAAVQGFAGPRWQDPVLPAGYADLIDRSTVGHHRLLALRSASGQGST